MTKIRCAIVDDEQPARELLENFTGKVPALEVVGKFKSPLETLDLINERQIDLLFLDIQMPDIKGTDFLKSIHQGPAVIFTTAYTDYALEGYSLHIADYLLKPFSFERFLQAVNKVIEMVHLKREHAGQTEILNVHADRRTYRIKLTDILYIEGLREYVSFYTRQGNRIISLQSMKKLEQDLPSTAFIRVHRSYIVRIDQVNYLEGNSLIIGDKRIPIGTNYRENVFGRLK